MKLGMIHQWRGECFDYVKGKDLSFIEICRNYDPETEEFIAHADEVKANVERTGVTIASVGRWNAHPNAGGKLDTDVYDRMVRLMDAAHHVGAPVFVCGCNYDKEISLFRNYSFAVEYFSRLLEETNKRNMKLAVYNCDWENFVYAPPAWEVVLGELPDLMLKYDCSHAYYRGADYLKELYTWLPRVAHMHVKGAVAVGGKRVDDPPAGLDNIDWQRVFAILYAGKYTGGLSIEPHSATWSGALSELGLDFTLRYIRRFLLG